MTNTYALTDYDVYQDEEHDNFLGSVIVARHLRKKMRKKRRKRKARRRTYAKPKLSKLHRRLKRPKIVIGRPKRLLSLPKKRIGSVRKTANTKPVETKNLPVKTTKKVSTKPKTPIYKLIQKTNPKNVIVPLSKQAKAEVKQLQDVQMEASKKAMKSDSKVGKIVKVIAITGLVGVTVFGIYKYIQNKKSA